MLVASGHQYLCSRCTFSSFLFDSGCKSIDFFWKQRGFLPVFAQKLLKGMNFDDFLKNSSKAEKIFFSLFFEFFLFISGTVLIFALDSVSPMTKIYATCSIRNEYYAFPQKIVKGLLEHKFLLRFTIYLRRLISSSAHFILNRALSLL